MATPDDRFTCLTIHGETAHRQRPSALAAFLALAIAASCGPGNPVASRSDAAESGELDSLVENRAEREGFSGVVAVEQNGQILLRRAYGLADRSRGIANRPETTFVVASVTQTFTAVATVQLIEQRRVALDAALSTYWPECPQKAAAQATVRQLLTHTARIGGVVTSDAFRREPRNFRSLDDYLKLTTSRPLTEQPGVGFRYTDGDSVLLGAIVERVSGQSYYGYARDHVFGPAGMTRTGFDLVPRPAGLAVGYTRRTPDGGALHGATPHDNASMLPEKASPGAGAYSTADDLLRFGNALLRGILLSPSASEALLEGEVATGDDGPRAHYGFGFFDGNFQNVRIVNHGGTGPGIDVGFDLYPELGLVVVVMSNEDPPTGQRMRDELRRRLAASHKLRTF
jgi:CubicO group peptidase (beta-lactamase class C family)